MKNIFTKSFYRCNKIILAMILLLCVSFSSNLFSQKLSVGYYPDYKRGVLPAEDIHLEHLTHVIHSFAYPDANGNLLHSDIFIYPELIERVHNEGKKIFVALGGWGNSDGFSPAFADSAKRAFFINNLIQFCETHGYDGIDIDWEYPTNSADSENLNKFVSELKVEKPELEISLALPGTAYSAQFFDFTFLDSYVEWFGCMAYDMAGGWSSTSGYNAPLFSDGPASVKKYIDYFTITRGIKPEKVVMGIPFYGTLFDSPAIGVPSGGASNLTYVESMMKFFDGWKYNWDDDSKVPYLLNPGGDKVLSYDNIRSVKEKCDYALQRNLAGVMIWEITHDYFKGTQPLLETVGMKMLNDLNDSTSKVKIVNILNGLVFSEADTVIVEVSAESSGGISRVELYLNTVKVDELFSAPYNFTLYNVEKGIHTIQAIAFDNSETVSKSDRIFIKSVNDTASEQTPYNGEPFIIPGKVEAEEFDKGGEGVSYHDTTPGNAAAAYSDFRLNEDVDCEPMDGGGYNVGYIIDGEWLEYSVVVDSSADYSLSCNVASGLQGGAFHLEINSADLTGLIETPGTGGWGYYQIIVKNNIRLEAGEHILRFYADEGDFNIDNIIFTYQSETGVDDKTLQNLSFRLNNNYPNPFNPATTISFALPEKGNVNLKIFDVTGKEIKRVLTNTLMESGEHRLKIDMSGFTSGVYFYQISFNNFIQTKKMTLLK